MVKTYGIDDNVNSDYNTSSAGEDSCDTVIYMGANGHISDRDLTDNERPPSPGTFKAMKLKLASSSEDETNEPISKHSAEESLNIINIKTTKEAVKQTRPEHKTLLSENEEDSNALLTVDREATVSNCEKAINVVAPIVRKQNSDSTRTSSPSTDCTKTSLINQLIENRNTNDVILLPQSHHQKQGDAPIPSEKELRKREKRIEKLLKQSLSDDLLVSSADVTRKNKKNIRNCYDGYTSDVSKSITQSYDKSSKFDGYISAPENNYRYKPVQVVKGTVRQQSIELSDVDELDKDVKRMSSSRDILNSYIADKLLAQLAQETCLDDIHNSKSTKVPVSPMDILLAESEPECNVDSLHWTLYTPDSKRLLESSVDTPVSGVDKLNIQDTSIDTTVLSTDTQEPSIDTPIINMNATKSNIDLPNYDLTAENIDANENINANHNILEKIENKTSDDEKIQNLDHVITVSSIPNFKVAKNPAFNHLISSPKVKRNSTRTASITNTKQYNGCSLDKVETYTPKFERSYSKEDTVSLLSVNESEAYDSDNYCSSTASPAVARRQPNRTPRLRYRWSTVFEEEESKKEHKNEKLNKNKKKDNLENEAKTGCVIGSPRKSHSTYMPKSYSTTGFIRSPKADIKLETLSPKPKKKFHLLSPKSERKQKKSNIRDNRMSGCSDASSGIGSSPSQSQTNSLHSAEDVKIDYNTERKSPSKYRKWLFG